MIHSGSEATRGRCTRLLYPADVPSLGLLQPRKLSYDGTLLTTEMSTQGFETSLGMAGWTGTTGICRDPKTSRAVKYRHTCAIQKQESRLSNGIVAQKSSDPEIS